MRNVDTLHKNELVAIVTAIVEALYPDGDTDSQWSSDELEQIAMILSSKGLTPADAGSDPIAQQSVRREPDETRELDFGIGWVRP